MSDHNIDGEVDSLFGSPPPSPGPENKRGGSPTLALPGSPSSTFVSLPKNVGTIALPGSHNISELSVSLPASPPGQHPGQLAQPSHRQYRFAEWIGPRAVSLPADDLRRAKPRKRKRKVKPASSTQNANGPTMSLPEASKPLPPNFLRNQQALLGLAGLVGRVNPAHLSPQGSRGSTAENPIIVEESSLPQKVSSWKARQPDASMTNSQAIADTLVSQGNIFPVLRSLMPYFGLSTDVGCCSANSQQQYRVHEPDRTSSVPAPPLKRRKLNSVPAGAKDWDVPYPFPPDEGPPGYLESWQKKRGKKLMMQLVSLVRDAVQKAAAKSSAHDSVGIETQKGPDNPPSQRPSSEVNDSTLFAAQGAFNSPVSFTSSPFDQDALFPDFPSLAHDGMEQPVNFTSNFDSLLGAVNDALNDPNVQLAGNDLAAMSAIGYPSTTASSPTLTPSTRLSTPCDLTRPSTAENKENAYLFQLDDLNFDDIPIDPALLDFSWSNPPLSQSITTPETPVGGALAPEADPVAPVAAPEMKSDLIPTDDPMNAAYFDPADATPIELSPFTPGDTSIPVSQENQPFSVLAQDLPAPSSDVQASPSSAAQNETPERPGEIQSTSSLLSESSSRNQSADKPVAKKADREDVLRRARIRREQLAAEIARAKIELWETTIEQGVLTHLSKDKELAAKDQ